MRRVIRLTPPFSENDVRKLKIGDLIYLTGLIITARDAAHKRLLTLLRKGEGLPVNFEGFPLYHCGPVARKVGDKWTILAAGPTTSMRMEPYESEIIRKLGIRMVIGKGGMGDQTVKAMAEFGAVYGSFTGGAAALAAKCVTNVKKVFWLDLSMPEALWVLEVKNFGPIIITIDSLGNNLYEKVLKEAYNKYRKIAGLNFHL